MIFYSYCGGALNCIWNDVLQTEIIREGVKKKSTVQEGGDNTVDT